MGSFIARQPNGLLCRFSTVVDCVTHWNMTDEQYIAMCVEKARQRANFHIVYMSNFEDRTDEYRHLTRNNYVKQCILAAKIDAKRVISFYKRPYEEVKERFRPMNMSKKEFKKICKEMEEPYDSNSKTSVQGAEG